VVILLGILIPEVTAFKVVASGHVIVKTGFPIVSVVALFMARNTAATNGS
jgi:hypothetical protein